MDDNFLNLHLLVTTSVANANRDDTGAPKQVTYGGAVRHRMSSQAMTRAKRIAYELASEQVTWRAKGEMTTLALTKLRQLAEDEGTPLTDTDVTDARKKLTVAVSSLVMNREKAAAAATARARARKSEDADTTTDDGDLGKKDTLTWLAEHEVDRLVRATLAGLRHGTEPGDFVNKRGRTQSLSIAAFGRMFAFRPDLQNEAAVQRSHAFTTHAADVEPDYFTAVNDLPAADEGAGAGHLDLAQYGGGVFYWHANVDRRQLWATWISGDDEQLTRQRLSSFFTALLLALPAGRKTTTAHTTLPDAVLAVPSSAPTALHQAFEAPVRAKDRGFRQPSVEELLRAHAALTAFAPRQFSGHAWYAGTLPPPATSDAEHLPSLDELVERCVGWALAGRPEPA